MKIHLHNYVFNSGCSARESSFGGVPNTSIKKNKVSFDFIVYRNIKNSVKGFTN